MPRNFIQIAAKRETNILQKKAKGKYPFFQRGENVTKRIIIKIEKIIGQFN